MALLRIRLTGSDDAARAVINLLQSLDGIEHVEEIGDLMTHMDDADSSSAGLSDVEGPQMHEIEIEVPNESTERKVRDAVNGRCLAGSVWGQAQRASDAPAVQLGPALKSDGGLRLAWDPVPADLWADGQRQFVCTLEQASPGTVMFDDLATKAVPQRERVCLDIPGRQVPCGRPHQAEEIGEMVLNRTVDEFFRELADQSKGSVYVGGSRFGEGGLSRLRVTTQCAFALQRDFC